MTIPDYDQTPGYRDDLPEPSAFHKNPLYGANWQLPGESDEDYKKRLDHLDEIAFGKPVERKFYQEGWTDEQMESWEFWNTFNGLWGVAQGQGRFDHKAWLKVRDYIKKIEPADRLPPTIEADRNPHS